MMSVLFQSAKVLKYKQKTICFDGFLLKKGVEMINPLLKLFLCYSNFTSSKVTTNSTRRFLALP
jgi:hypothetical protein